jgi:hypothetical protein
LEFHDLVTFYHQERVASLNLVQSVIRAAQDLHHPYHSECKTIYSKWKDNDVKDSCTKQWELHRAKSPPVEVQSLAETKYWTKWHVMEQKGYLELLILLNYVDFPNPIESEQLILSLLDYEFGNKQPNRPFIDDMNEILNLCSVLFLTALNFEIVLERVLQRKHTDSLLLDQPDTVTKLNDAIWKFVQSWTGDLKVLGIFSVGWAVYLQVLLMILSDQCPAEYKELFYRLVRGDAPPQRLFQFGYSNCLDQWAAMSSSFRRETNELAYKCILKGFLNMITTTQNTGTLPDRHKLVECATRTFSHNSELSRHFWIHDYQFEECRSLLEVTQRAFPATDSFLAMIASLVGNADTADYVFQYCQKMDGLADLLRKEYEPTFETVEGQNVFYWRGEGIVTGAPHINILVPTGAPAIEIAPGVVFLQTTYSVWHLCLALLDSFLHSSDNEGLIGNIRTTEAILDLFNTILRYADDQTLASLLDHLALVPGKWAVYGDSSPEAFTGIVGEIMNRCCSHSNVHIQIITRCLEIMQHLILHFPDLIWKRLRVQRLLPQYSSSPTVNPGYIQHSVIPAECAVGSYPATLAFLRLVKEMVVEAQILTTFARTDETEKNLGWVKYDILFSCIPFVLREIFPVYGGWKYVRIHEKFEIGLIILQILTLIVRNTRWYFMEQDGSEEKAISAIQKFVIDWFVESPTMYQLSPLLDIVATGNAVPLQYHIMGRRYEAEMLENSIIESLLLIRQFFVILFNRDNGISGLEKALLDKTIRLADGSSAELLQIIANYVDYHNNAQFAQLSTEILTILCRLSKRSGRPAASFVGYFGAEAFTLVSKFTELVNDESKRAAHSDIVQMGVFNFVSAVIECQPGLGAMFLNGFEPKALVLRDQKVKEVSIRESSILYPVILVVKNWESVLRVKPLVLASVLHLLDVLWKFAPEHNATLGKLRENEGLWKQLCSLLLAPAENSKSPYFGVAKAHCLRILVTEGLHVLRASTNINTLHELILKTIKDALLGPVAFGQAPLKHNQDVTVELLQLCHEIQPPINLNHFRRLTWSETFDPERLFGPAFVYDSELLQRTLNLDRNPRLHGPGALILEHIASLNSHWSDTHAQIDMTQSSVFAIRLITSKLFDSEKFSLHNVDLLKLAKALFANLKSTSQAYVHIAYKTELTLCLYSVIAKWISLVRKHPSQQVFQEVVELLELLQGTFLVAQFPLGPVGKFSEYPFHRHGVSCILLLSQLLETLPEPTSAIQSQKLFLVYKSLLPIVCHGLYFCLAGPVANQDSALLLSTCIELTRRNPQLWLPYMEKFRVFELLLSTMASCDDEALVELILVLLSSVSGNTPCATKLVGMGIVTTLCNNPFSGVTGDVGTQRHRVWTLFLSVITQLVRHVPITDKFFLESVVGFLKVYEDPVRIALTDHDINSERLIEIERLTGLITLTAQRTEDVLFQTFIPYLMQLLHLYVFLFKNPHELRTRSKGVCEVRMVSICGHILGLLGLVGRMNEIIGGKVQEVPSFFVPTLSSFHDLGITFGTLFDLIRYMMSSNSTSKKDDAKLRKRIGEIALCLAYAQLRIYSGDEDLEREYQELHTEFQSLMQEFDREPLWTIFQ